MSLRFFMQRERLAGLLEKLAKYATATCAGIFWLTMLAGLAWAGGPVWRWSNPTPHGNDIVGMASANGLTVQVTEHGQIYTSYDYVNWTPCDSHTTLDLLDVNFFGNRLIVCGEKGTIVYSDDGANFVYTNLNTSNWLVALAASSNLVVAVGDNAAIYTSLDGASYNRQAVPPGVGTNWLRGVAWGAGTFVTVGERGYVATSPNGTNWTHRAVSGGSFTNDLDWVIYLDTPNGPANGFPAASFLAVTDDGKALTSTNNGANWYPVSNLPGTNILYTAAGNDSTRLLAGDQELRLGSLVSNAVVWPRQTGSLPSTAPVWTYYSSLWDPDGCYWLGGESGMMVQGALTTNGTYGWKTPFFCTRDWLWDMTVAAGLYIAVGDNARILTSDDGINWTPEEVPLTNSIAVSNTVFFSVGGNSNLLIAVGSQGSIAVSPNSGYPVITTNSDGSLSTNLISSLGLAWYSLPAFTTNDLHAVGCLSNQYFATGGNGVIYKSANGTNWTTAATPTTNYLSCLESFPGGLCAVGDNGTILTSADGAAWSKRPTGKTNWLSRVRWLGGKLITVGENGMIITSTNGTNWASTPSGTTAWLNDVQMVNNVGYIVGTQGTVLASTNLTAWTNLGTITWQSLYGAATQDGQLVMVGIDGIIIRAQLIPDSTPISFVEFSRSSGENVFLAAGQPDQRFTLDTSTNLNSWATGPLLEFLNGASTLLFLQDTGSNAPSPQFFRATLAP